MLSGSNDERATRWHQSKNIELPLLGAVGPSSEAVLLRDQQPVLRARGWRWVALSIAKLSALLVTVVVCVATLLAICKALSGYPPHSTAKVFKIHDAQLGRCMDGSPPAFFYRPAVSEEGKNRWMIMLEGGGQCSDQWSCAERPQALTSSDYLAESIELGGVFSTHWKHDAPGEANLISIHYCSSDGWHGDVDDPFPDSPDKAILKHFRGVRVLDEVFELLMDSSGKRPRPEELDIMSSDHNILFGGFSAGGRGSMVNADRLRKRFKFMNFRAFLDSPYYVLASKNLVEQTKNVYLHFVEGTPGAAENNVSSWKDLFGEFRMPQVETQFLLKASQFDTYQWHEGFDDFVHETYQQLEKLEPLSACSIVFSDDAAVHAVGGNDKFFDQQVHGLYLGEIFGNFAFGNVSQSCGAVAQKYINPVGQTCGPCEPLD